MDAVCTACGKKFPAEPPFETCPGCRHGFTEAEKRLQTGCTHWPLNPIVGVHGQGGDGVRRHF